MSANVEFSRRWWDAFNAARMDGLEPLLELCDEDLVMRNPPEFPVRDNYRGHAGIRQWYEESWDVIDDLRIDLEDVIEVDEETVLMMLRMRGVASYTKIEIDQPWAAICTIRRGKFYRGQGYASRREALRAAGLRE